jgi:Helix-turn-helix domain
MIATAGTRADRSWTTVLDGSRLRRLRREHGLSQEQLAARAAISLTTVARLERQSRASCAAGHWPGLPRRSMSSLALSSRPHPRTELSHRRHHERVRLSGDGQLYRPLLADQRIVGIQCRDLPTLMTGSLHEVTWPCRRRVTLSTTGGRAGHQPGECGAASEKG